MNAFRLSTLSTTGALAFASVATAGTYSTGFESPISTGSIHGQDGWSATNANLDQEVVDGVGRSGSQAWRLSNQYTTPSFGDHSFSAPLSDGHRAGETTAVGANHNYHEYSVWFRSVSPTADGSVLSISATDAAGSRINYISLMNGATNGIAVFTYGVTSNGSTANFAEYYVGQDLDRSAWHKLTVQTTFVEGANNDVVNILINDSLVTPGGITSWEDYYRYSPEQAGNGNQLFGVDRVGFFARGAADASAQGFYFDDFSQISAVPEPASLALLAIGGGVAMLRRSRKA